MVADTVLDGEGDALGELEAVLDAVLETVFDAVLDAVLAAVLEIVLEAVLDAVLDAVPETVLDAMLDSVFDGEDDALGVLEAELDGDGDGEVEPAAWSPTVKSTCATPLKATEEVRSTRTKVQLPARTSHRPSNAPDSSVRSGADQVPGVRRVDITGCALSPMKTSIPDDPE
jgi:hypothetical protein